MLLREQHNRLQRRLPPNYVERLVRATKQPQPLKYRLHPAAQPVSLQKPHTPPLSPVEQLPFSLERTLSGNLPVYVKYNCNHVIKKTIVRKISGDVDKFVEELRKVVSNAEVRKKVGKVEIPGVHKESVETWLMRLGL
jgi:hypothetical protein